MTQEDKQLLLKDLCARLPYGVMLKGCNEPSLLNGEYWQILKDDIDANKMMALPYLRPMSSITEEEKIKYQQLKNQLVCQVNTCNNGNLWKQTYKVDLDEDSIDIVDWLNAHHFDYRGLIEKGLALPAPDGMYNVK